jgi:hypothetical protein
MHSKIGRKVSRLVVGGLLGAAATTSAFAQNAQGLLNNRFVFNLGAFIVNNDVKATLNGQSTTNPEVDFNNTFGKASDATRIRLDGMWRITPTQHVRFMWFENKVTRDKVLDRDVNWDDVTYHVGANVHAESKVSIYELAYEYAFLRAPTYEVAGTAGIHYSDFSLSLSGTGTVNGNPGSFQSKSSSLPAPLPVIGIRGGWAFAPDWYAEGLGQLFKVNIDGYNGNWFDARAGVTWMFMRNFGVGLGYNRFTTRVDVSKSNFNGNLKFGYSGIQAYLTGTF